MAQTLDLKLDSDEEHPRRLVPFPDGQIVAFGGDDGTLSCVTNNNSEDNFSTRILRQLDEAAVRAVAVSMDGKRVAVGFDNFSTRIYQYNNYNNNDTDSHHPFVPPPKAGSDEDDDADDEADNGFLSQPDRDDEEDDTEGSWAGPQMEGIVRDLKFLPNSHFLAIASEDGLFVVDVSSPDTMNDRFLEIQAEKENDGSGVRGLSITDNEMQMMASLTMDGRLCLWKVGGLDNLKSVGDKVPCFRESQCCVPKRDVGEALEADPSDRSCFPHWVHPDIVALPGKTSLQFRVVTLLNERVVVEESKQTENSDPAKGHIEPIVALTSKDDFIVSSGRDGRVILWHLQEDEDDLPIANFVRKLGQFDSIPTSFYWNGNTLFMACANGSLQIVTDMKTKLPKTSPVLPPSKQQVTEEAPASKPLPNQAPEKALERTGESTQKPVKAKNTGRPKITFTESEDDEDSDKENQTKEASSEQSKEGKADSDMSDDDDSMAPETQAPVVPKTVDNLSASDDDSSPKKKSTIQQPDLNEQSSDKPSMQSPQPSTDMETNEDDKSVEAVMREEQEEKNEKSDMSDIEEEPESKDLPSANKNSKRLVKQSNFDGDDDDDDIFDTIDHADGTNTASSSKRVSFIDDEAEDTNDAVTEEGQATADTPSEAPTVAGAEGADDTAAAQSQDAESGFDQGGDQDNDNGFPIQDDDDDSRVDGTFEQSRDYDVGAGTFSGPVLPEPQAAFAPASTPLDLSRRFLCWNNVGSITLISDDMGHRSTVDINFTDKAFRRPVSFTDNQGFILGSLGDDGAIFATDVAQDDDDHLNDDEDDVMHGLSFSAQTKAALRKSQKQRMRQGSAAAKGSSLYFHRFETFASLRDKDWYLTLPDGELVLGCACGQGWAAAVTSRKFLRLFTSGGAQGQILWLPGNPVSIVGRGRFLAVFYHESMPLTDGTQKLGYMLYDAVGSKTICKGPVCCITAGSSLSWAGFSNDCSLMTMDSDGMLSMLLATSLPSDENGDSQVQPTSWEWSPLLDTVGLRKSSEDNFWPITVFEGKLVCIPLKGGKQFPDAARRPTTAVIGMKMPFARSTLAKSSILEELSVRSNIALTQKKVNNDISCGDLMGDDFEEDYHTMCATVDKVSLKLFAHTVEAGKLERALDLVDRLHLEKSYDLAMKIAENHDKLVDFIEETKESKFPPEEVDDLNEEQEDYEEADGSYGANSSPQGSSKFQSISPESNSALKSSSKRPIFGGHQGRNVRARAF